jgi:2-octaprenylphenol hydroxylase
MALDDDAFLAELQREFGYRLGTFSRVGTRASYPLILSKALRLTATRSVLIGNSAHGLHPVSAQGFNLGLRDVAAIVDCIADKNSDPGDAAVLERYAAWRRSDQEKLVRFTDGLVKLFGSARLRPGSRRAVRIRQAHNGLGRPPAQVVAWGAGEMNRQYQVAVVGGGVTGLMAATLLAKGPYRERLEITLVDAAPRAVFSPDDDVALRVSAISTGTAVLFDSVGAWEYVLATRISPYDGMRVWDEGDTPDTAATLRFDAEEFAVPQLGFIVENVLLQDVLLQQLDRADVTLRFETPVRALRRSKGRFEIELETGGLFEADLVIGADGAHSRVREMVGIETNEWPYEQTAFVTHLRPEQPHGSVARQRFLRDGPLGILPLEDGRVSVVWSTSPEKAIAALEADDAATGRMLSEVSDYVLGELEVAGPKGAFPLCARHAQQYVLPNLALIGDAAHAIHPLAGQGANLGLQDAAELARQVTAALEAGLHPGDKPVLRRYERARKGANATMLHFMTSLNRLFATDSGPIRGIRTAGMRVFNRSGLIRERAVKVALGVD